jgi:hypothetical protein
MGSIARTAVAVVSEADAEHDAETCRCTRLPFYLRISAGEDPNDLGAVIFDYLGALWHRRAGLVGFRNPSTENCRKKSASPD